MQRRTYAAWAAAGAIVAATLAAGPSPAPESMLDAAQTAVYGENIDVACAVVELPTRGSRRAAASLCASDREVVVHEGAAENGTRSAERFSMIVHKCTPTICTSQPVTADAELSVDPLLGHADLFTRAPGCLVDVSFEAIGDPEIVTPDGVEATNGHESTQFWAGLSSSSSGHVSRDAVIRGTICGERIVGGSATIYRGFGDLTASVRAGAEI